MSGDRSTALLIIDHGSVLHESNSLLERLAELLRQQRPELIVHVAHMEVAPPTIEQGILSCINDGAREIIVHPYMLGPGRHATRDIPKLIEEQSVRFPDVHMRVTPPLGLHEKIGQVVLERAGL